MNNFLQAMMAAAMRGEDPMQTVQRMAGQDKRMAGALGLIRGKSPAQLEQTARNMAKERGIDLDAMARGMGLVK